MKSSTTSDGQLRSLPIGIEGPVPRLLFQQIANFCQQLDLWRRLGGESWRLSRFQFVDPLDREEQHPRNNKEVQRDSEKLTPAEHCALLLRVGV